MKVTRVLALGILLLVTTEASAQALRPWVLYDNFNTALINPSKWFGAEGNGPITRLGPGAPAEAERIVQGGRLRMSYRSYGSTTSDAGSTNSVLRLMFVNPAAIVGIKATMLIRRYELTGCPSNVTAITRTQARLVGVFFNAGASTVGDFTNDVFAQLRVQRRVDSTDAPGVFLVQGYVFRSDDMDSNFSTDMPIVTLGTLTVGIPQTVAMQWDRPNHRFLFSLGATQAAIPYPWSDTALSANVDKRLDVRNLVPNCTSLPKPMASIESGFDDVYVTRE